MSDELADEIEAIRSIYGEGTLRAVDSNKFYVLSVPEHGASIRLEFPFDYPYSTPRILGVEGTGENKRKGYGSLVLNFAREILQRLFEPGSVCLFDVLQELDGALIAESKKNISAAAVQHVSERAVSGEEPQPVVYPDLEEPPLWKISAPVKEKKSIFLARACSVTSPAQARAFVAQLLDTDKRAAKATHNITAYRIRCHSNLDCTSQATFQDCDDDGETAAGSRLLHLLHVMDVWGVLIVVSRWFGGVKLGPDRFNIINNVAREALVEGGWTRSRIMID
ncbi:eIF2 kinase Gcn2p negative regulator [Puttea exsequens]|nr:eIF2 kinase Gcn2p negative regulator [Puttea exsequens]